MSVVCCDSRRDAAVKLENRSRRTSNTWFALWIQSALNCEPGCDGLDMEVNCTVSSGIFFFASHE